MTESPSRRFGLQGVCAARVVSTLALCALLAACAASSPPRDLITLAAVHAPQAAVSAASAPATAASASTPGEVRRLVVRRVDVPEYLQSRSVRYRADASTVADFPNAIWAERIETAVTRELAEALRQQLPGWSVCTASCDASVPALSLQVELAPLAFWRADGQLRATARWTVAPLNVRVAAAPTGAEGPGRRGETSGEQDYRMDAGGRSAQDFSQALARLLGALGGDVARSVMGR